MYQKNLKEKREKKKVCILDGLFHQSPESIEELEKLGREVRILDLSNKEEWIKENMPDTEIVIFGGTVYLSKDILNMSDKLKTAIFVGAGYDSWIDMEYANKKNIEVKNAPGANANSVAELTVIHIMNMWRDVPHQNDTMKNFNPKREMREEIQGKTIGILGLGNIGTKVAKMMKYGFGCNIIYNSRTQKKELEKENEYNFVDRKTLLKESDVLVLLVPLNKQTENIISMKELKLMKKNAILINTSRANLVNGEDLLKALQEGTIRGASFDGYYDKILPKSKKEDKIGLISLENEKFFITPYTGSFTKEAFENMRRRAIENVEKVLSKGLKI